MTKWLLLFPLFVLGCAIDGGIATVKNIIIEENGVSYLHEGASLEELTKYCEDYKLSEADVIEFFRVARPAAESEYREVATNLGPNCNAKGIATYNGVKVKWHIGSDRYGAFSSEDYSIFQRYYCHDCNKKVFEEDCDFACEMSGSDK